MSIHVLTAPFSLGRGDRGSERGVVAGILYSGGQPQGFFLVEGQGVFFSRGGDRET